MRMSPRHTRKLISSQPRKAAGRSSRSARAAWRFRRGSRKASRSPRASPTSQAAARPAALRRIIPAASGRPGFLIDQGGHIALHRHLAPFRRQLPQGQALSLDDQRPQARMQHHALLVEADYLRHAGDAEAPALVEGQLVGQNFLFLGHGHSPFALGTAYVRLTRNIPPFRKAPGSSPVSG